MVPNSRFPVTIFTFFVLILAVLPTSQSAFTRKLALVQQPATVLKYHKGQLLFGNVTVNLIWYGKFTPAQRAIVVDFIQSLSPRTNYRQPASPPTVASWWSTIQKYSGRPVIISLGKEIFLNYTLGKSLNDSKLEALASKYNQVNTVNFILTASDVSVYDFCMNRCGLHAWTRGKTGKFTYAWVGNSVPQCPDQCAWPFHRPTFGPQTPPLRPPNRDVGIDGMIINIATVLPGTVTNPFDQGYYQGPSTAPLEAVTACTGIFGSGAYPGYPGTVLKDKKTGASYNALGVKNREYLVPAMWDPKTSTCKTLV